MAILSRREIGMILMAAFLFPLVLLIAYLRSIIIQAVKSFGFNSLFSLLVVVLMIFLLTLSLTSLMIRYRGAKPAIPRLRSEVIVEYPIAEVTLLCGTLAIPLILSEVGSRVVNHQIYGLIFDGYGAALLAYEGTNFRWSAPLSSKPREFWGMWFLIGGFVLQILHLMPWVLMQELVVDILAIFIE